MTPARSRLPNRRPAYTETLEVDGQAFEATVGFDPEGGSPAGDSPHDHDTRTLSPIERDAPQDIAQEQTAPVDVAPPVEEPSAKPHQPSPQAQGPVSGTPDTHRRRHGHHSGPWPRGSVTHRPLGKPGGI